jgi:hydroxyacylglutathione hydrolase
LKTFVVLACYTEYNMLKIHSFTFNPFQENTYVVWDDELKECAIIDPGCSNTSEQNELAHFIKNEKLKPVYIINTHAHIDHVLGNAWVKKTYNIPLLLHKEDLKILHSLPDVARMYGVPVAPSPDPDKWMKEGDKILVGQHELEVMFLPGHAPGHVGLYYPKQKLLISGDVLFYESIGRTDLPGGNYDTLMKSITEKVLKLPEDVTVYSGHGPETTIKHEKENNPFVLEYLSL